MGHSKCLTELLGSFWPHLHHPEIFQSSFSQACEIVFDSHTDGKYNARTKNVYMLIDKLGCDIINKTICLV